MKICVLIEERIQGGFQKVAVMEVITLNKMGHNATLGVLRKSNHTGYEELIKKNDIRVDYFDDKIPKLLKFNFKFPFFAYFSLYHLTYAFFIPWFVKDLKYDAVVVHGTYTAFSGIKFAKKYNLPVISFIHDPISFVLANKYSEKFLGKIIRITVPLAKIFDRWIVNNSNKILAYPNILPILREYLPNKSQKITKIWNGVTIIGESEINYIKEPYVLSVTKWDQSKNYQMLLDIWVKYKLTHKLKIVGTWFDEGERESFVKLIAKNKLVQTMEITGEVTEKELQELYKNAKLIIHPCTEAFGMTILEAAGCGCPGIISKESGVIRLFPNKIIEMMPSEKDQSRYYELMQTILSLSQDEYKILCSEYYKIATANSWEKHCQIILDNL